MPAAIVANLIILSILVAGTALYALDAALYYHSSQEDRLLEWLTYWAFVVAAVGFLAHAVRDRRERGGVPWFAVGLGIFCVIVALEEISWGQRLIGYKPPDYFLTQNYQQEFNLHNVVGTELRMAALQLILCGYGVVLSSLALIKPAALWLNRMRVIVSPPALMPGFASLSALYAWYPLDYTGEWVECALGFGFAFVASLAGAGNGSITAMRNVLFSTVAAFLLAVPTVAVVQMIHGSDADRVAQAREEIASLVTDFEAPQLHTRCGIHKRLFTFVQEYNQTYLGRGEFAARLRESDQYPRADYLLDPWNAPYWVRHHCADGRSVAFVYSFGPDRRRDSSEWKILGDDIGGYFIGP